MKAKITLCARVPQDGKFPFVRVQIKSGKPIPVAGATSYYLRYSENGRQVMRAVGQDLDQAYLAWANRTLTQESNKLGLANPVGEERQLSTKLTVMTAAKNYIDDLADSNKVKTSYSAYRNSVNLFAEFAGYRFVEDLQRDDLIKFRSWLSKRPQLKRKHANPERTWANHCLNVAIFLKKFGKRGIYKKADYPYHEKKIVAHCDDELKLLYTHANPEELFLLNFFIGSMARDNEAAHCRYQDLTGTTLTIYGKQHKTRTVEISTSLRDAIKERQGECEYIFPNGECKPNMHLLRDLQSLAKRAGAKFHTELHKLRKTGASRRYKAGVPIMVLMAELGHTSLAITQKYLADVKPEETKRAIAAADFRLPCAS
ncbi:MAG TPA: tyrosine-type recombinase/integrase [Candidatus Acidoferrum sp.]